MARKNNVFDAISSSSSDEFFHGIPKGYEKGKTKYVIITGSVISGIGKGIFSASLGRLLVNRGLKVEPIKVEAYMNVDAGTLNPFRHGEVFVLDDGTETDMDLGTYERYLDMDLTKDNFVTSGTIYSRIIGKEREGKYLGRDVQFIPHVTGEAKHVLRNLAMKSNADVVLVEIGGTVGDYENTFALEAVREMAYEEGQENVCMINLTYILKPKALGEHKSKAAQLGIKRMLEMGIQPDIVICRSETPIPDKIREKISMNVNVPLENVIGAHDFDNIYEIPMHLRKLGVDEAVLKMLKLNEKFPIDGQQKELEDWTKGCLVKEGKEITIGIAGKYTGLYDSYISIIKALEHCAARTGADIKIKWIETTEIEKGNKKAEDEMKNVNGLIVPGGFGYRGIAGKIQCVKFAREKNIPFLGLCLGFQMAVIEFAKNVLKLDGANSTEFDSNCKDDVICILPEQEEIEGLGGTMRLGGFDVFLKKDSNAFKIYGKEKIRERFRHRWNVNTKYIEALEKQGMVFSGNAGKKKIMQVLELPDKKFFLATQFHPEFTSKPLKPNPLFLAFTKACLE